MKTLEMTVTVGPNRQRTLPLPPDINPGRLRVLVVEALPLSAEDLQALQFSTYPVNLNLKDFTFRREDIHGDDGR